VTAPLAFDFCFVPNGPVSETVSMASLGETLGYRCMWIPDQGFCRDPFLLYAAAASVTRRIDLGIGIATPLTRHPAQIARAAATMAELAPERLRLGMGSGNIDNVVRPLGMPADRPVGRVRDGIAAVRALLAGEAVRFADDDAGVVPDVRLELEPPGSVPIYIGARGPQMLTLAGKVADGVLVESLFNGDGLPHARGCIARGAEATGRSAEDVDVVAWQLVVVADDPAPAIESLRGWAVRILQAGPPAAMLRIGVDQEVLDRVTAALADGDHDAAVAAVTPDTVRCILLVGTPDELVERIHEIRARGATALNILGIGSPAQIASNLVRVANEVMPAFQSEAATA
jgi:5,10-methylenetetrahydromethanopterin reductase